MRFYSLYIFMAMSIVASAQLYELKNPKRDSANIIHYYDRVPELADSFYVVFIKKDLNGIKKFVPNVRYLRATFDTLDIEYREEQVIYRQQMLLRGLQKDYHKILKRAEKKRITLTKIEVVNTHYDYGIDEKNNEYCYVTVMAKRRKKSYELKYLAIKLNNKWFVGDELSFQEV